VNAPQLPPWPVFESDELSAVERVLRSGRVNYWTGTLCREFEMAWSASHRGRPSICMSNGSVTMDAGIRALGIGAGDEVIVSPRSFVASAMCVVLAGATPVFADVDPVSGCITADSAEEVRGPRTRAVIPVHVGGWPCDMPALVSWAGRHGIRVFEDCAQAHGGHVDGDPLGTFGDLASWSFCQDKSISTGGEGGMLCTRDVGLHRRCWSIAQHGKDHDSALGLLTGDRAPGFRWLVDSEGTNLRMTEMQAAIGLRQLAKLPGWLTARRRNSLIMQEALREFGFLRVPSTPEGHAHYRCTAFVEDDAGMVLRDEILDRFGASGVPAMSGSCGEIYREEALERRGLTPASMGRGALDGDGRLPVARRLGETSLSFLCHHTIDEGTMHEYARAVTRLLRRVQPPARRGPAAEASPTTSPGARSRR
jgi:dTDP-4-amino-4,6-dideoxygalactose transaminase